MNDCKMDILQNLYPVDQHNVASCVFPIQDKYNLHIFSLRINVNCTENLKRVCLVRYLLVVLGIKTHESKFSIKIFTACSIAEYVRCI